jgi:hypothetical protein
MQKSSTYSTSVNRFSGWGEQEHGTKTKRKRIATRKGRSGSFKRQVSKRARFKGKRFYSPRDLGTSSPYIQSPHHAAQVMIIWARRNLGADETPFLIYGHRKIEPGLFYFAGSKLYRLQYLNPPKKRRQPRRIKWMSISTRRMFRKNSLPHMWKKVIEKQKGFW